MFKHLSREALFRAAAYAFLQSTPGTMAMTRAQVALALLVKQGGQSPDLDTAHAVVEAIIKGEV